MRAVLVAGVRHGDLRADESHFLQALRAGNVLARRVRQQADDVERFEPREFRQHREPAAG